MVIRPNDILSQTKKVIKPYNSSLIVMDGPILMDKMKIDNVEIPFDDEFSTIMKIPANTTVYQEVSYGNIDKKMTFLAINVNYLYTTNQNSTTCRDLPKYLTYYFESDPNKEFTLAEIMILTSSPLQKLEKIYIKNESAYDAQIHILAANKGDDITEYETGVLKFFDRVKFYEVLPQEELKLSTPTNQYIGDEEITLTGDVSLKGNADHLGDPLTFTGTIVLTGSTQISEYVDYLDKTFIIDGKTILRKENYQITALPTVIGENTFTEQNVSLTGKPTIIGDIVTTGWTKETIAFNSIDDIKSKKGELLFDSTNVFLTGFTKDALITLSSTTEQKLFPEIKILRTKDEYGNTISEEKDFIFDKGEYSIEFDTDLKTSSDLKIETDGKYYLQKKIY